MFNKDKDRVLLINPPMTIPKGAKKRCIPPIGLLCIARYLDNHKFNNDVHDMCVSGWHNEKEFDDFVTYGTDIESIKSVVKPEHKVVGITVNFSICMESVLRIADIIKSINDEIIIVVGGLHPSLYPADILDKSSNIDYIIRGEGEKRFIIFMSGMVTGHIYANQDGLAINSPRIINDVRERLEGNEIPMPAYHKIDLQPYFDINVPFSPVPLGKRVLPIFTSRGCPIGCYFCANTRFLTKVKKRNIDDVIDEIKILKGKYNIDEIQFGDDNLTFDMDRSVALFSKLKRLNLLWCTPNGVMINKLNENLLEIMAESGMYQVTLSVDGASVRVLKEIQKKPVDLERIPTLVRKSRELGVFTHGTLVIGLPGEEPEEVDEALEFMIAMGFTSASVFIAAAIPGSKLYDNLIKKGSITKEDALYPDTSKSKFKLTGISSKELERKIVETQKIIDDNTHKNFPDEWEKKYKNINKSEVGRLV